MAEKKEPSRRSTSEKQSPPRRSDVIRCENCGEDYSITYKRCPFCDERPGRGINGRRVAGGGKNSYGSSIHPIQLIGLVVSLVLIIAALFIVFRYVGPLLFTNRSAGSNSSASTSQSASNSSASISAPGSDISSSSGDVSQTVTPAVTVTSIKLDQTDVTLQADESLRLTAAVLPADAGAEVVWTSSNPGVLAVDQNGLVRNVNSGSSLVKVTVTAACGGKSAECTIYCRPGSTGTSTGTSGTIVNAENGLNIRSGPGSTYDVVASAENGAYVVILEDTGTGWYKIDYGSGKTGYVSSDYVSVSN